MTMNVCQDGKMLDAIDGAMCDSCAQNLETDECLEHLALRIEIESQGPDMAKRHLVTSCTGWRPRGMRMEIGNSLKPEIARAGITHVCRGCAPAESSACRTRETLDRIEDRSHTSGRRVETIVYSCYPKPPPAHALYRIGAGPSR